MSIPWETNEPSQDTSVSNAKQEAFRFLAYRARSQAEVHRKLAKRYSEEVIDRVIAELLEQRFLDDAAFAKEWRQQRERRRPRGENLLRRELLQLGIDREVVSEALEDFDAADNAYRAAQPLAKRLEGNEYGKFRQKVWAYLQRRGFAHEVIASVVERIWGESADLLHGDVDSESNQENGQNVQTEGTN